MREYERRARLDQTARKAQPDPTAQRRKRNPSLFAVTEHPVSLKENKLLETSLNQERQVVYFAPKPE